MGVINKYYHGGVKGLQVGEKILPPDKTGTSTLLQYAREVDPNCKQRSDRVYLTTDITAAIMFAAALPEGDVYEVVPLGQLEHDPDCVELGLSFQCEAAEIKAVVSVRCGPYTTHWLANHANRRLS